MVVKYFFQNMMILEAWKRTYITLIFQITSPQTINDYQLIGLCNTIYKIVAKVLEN